MDPPIEEVACHGKHSPKLQHVHYHPNPTPEYIGGSLVQDRNPKPTVRGDRLELKGGKPTFALMSNKKSVRKFDSKCEFKSATLVYDFVLMDGSFVCFPARLSSGIGRKLANVALSAGSAIAVLDHDVIWLNKRTEGEDDDRRLVMLIKDFAWKEAPVVDFKERPGAMEAHECCAEDEFVKARFDMEAVEACSRDKCVQFFNCCSVSPEVGWVWTFAQDFAIKAGCFLHAEENKRQWKLRKERMGKRKFKFIVCSSSDSDNEECQCATRFHLGTCVLHCHPVSRVCRKNLYEQVYDRLGGDIDGNSFDEFPNNHKRWCLCWRYAINVFGINGGKKREELPTCFVEHVRAMCPAPKGATHCGHKGI